MITVHDVSMRYGSKVLFEEVTTTFSDGRRYGLTGPNGSGKSTFMKLLTGELPPQKGSVARPANPERSLHPPGRHRLPDDHHLRRRLRRHGRHEDRDPRGHRGQQRAARE